MPRFRVRVEIIRVTVATIEVEAESPLAAAAAIDAGQYEDDIVNATWERTSDDRYGVIDVVPAGEVNAGAPPRGGTASGPSGDRQPDPPS